MLHKLSSSHNRITFQTMRTETTSMSNTATATTNDAAATNSSDSSNRNNVMIIPHSLPPNTILLHYDDGYTRVLPNLYWLLVQKGIITECVMDHIKRSGSGGFTVCHTNGCHRYGGHAKEEGGDLVEV